MRSVPRCGPARPVRYRRTTIPAAGKRPWTGRIEELRLKRHRLSPHYRDRDALERRSAGDRLWGREQKAVTVRLTGCQPRVPEIPYVLAMMSTPQLFD